MTYILKWVVLFVAGKRNVWLYVNLWWKLSVEKVRDFTLCMRRVGISTYCIQDRTALLHKYYVQ